MDDNTDKDAPQQLQHSSKQTMTVMVEHRKPRK